LRLADLPIAASALTRACRAQHNAAASNPRSPTHSGLAWTSITRAEGSAAATPRSPDATLSGSAKAAFAGRPAFHHDPTTTVSEGGTSPVTPEKRADYWKSNLRLLTILLIIWFVVSYGFGIILVEPLNTIMLGGYPLGFWFAQQGSIYVFLVLIFVYAISMNRLDKKFEVDEE
jgi:putative solute:sodium symporter small subunit